MRHQEKNQMVFGIRAIMEAIESGKEIEKLMIQGGLRGELYHEFFQLIKYHGIRFQNVPLQALNRITRKNHQGAIAYLSPITYQNIENLLPMLYEQGKNPFLLLLDRITDVRNFGAIARTAECSGVDCIIVPSRGGAAINEDAIKTSAGALHKIAVSRVDNMKDTMQFLKDSGLKIFGVSEKAEKNYYHEDYTGPTALMLGSEEDGISPAYMKYLDGFVKIPMKGNIESLNVSVAGGILMFEVLKQRIEKAEFVKNK
jgi:23S rRNA (guanosine2251-2'-O)-methyltransferase